MTTKAENTLKLLNEMRESEMTVRGEGSDAWNMTQKGGLSAAERRDYRAVMNEKEAELSTILDEVALLTKQYQAEHAAELAAAAEAFPAPPVDDPKVMGILLTRGLNGLMWNIVSTEEFLDREKLRLQDEAGRGADQDKPTTEGVQEQYSGSPYEARRERYEEGVAQLEKMRVAYAWALPEAQAAIDAVSPHDNYRPSVDTEKAVRAKRAAGKAGAARGDNPFAKML